MTPTTRSLALPLMAAALTLSACQQPPNSDAKPVAAEQAKQQSVELHGGAMFVPPPRTIDDILPLLENLKPPEDEIAKRRALAAAEPPAGLKGNDLASFYARRCVARRDLGRIGEALADARQSVAIARQADVSWANLSYDLGVLILTENQAGHIRDELGHRLENEKLTPASEKGARFSATLLAARPLIQLGDLAAAEQRLASQEKILEESRSWNGAELYFPNRQRTFYQIKGELDRGRGQYAEAEAAFRVALEGATKTVELYPRWKVTDTTSPLLEVVNYREYMRIELAWVLALEGKLAEAEATAREALINQLRDIGATSVNAAIDVSILALILSEEGRQAEAETLAKRAVAMKLASGLAPSDWSVVGSRIEVATYLIRQDRGPEALMIYQSIASDLADDTEGRERYLDTNSSYALALLGAGQGTAALGILDKAVAKTERELGKTNRFAAETRGWHAVALERLGRHEEALADFQAALPILLSARLPNGASEQSHTLQAILRAYLHLLSEIRGPSLESQSGDVAGEAFRMADYARGQAVQQAVANAVARLHITDPNLAELARREQDTGQNITALEGTLVNVVASPESQRDPAAIAKLRQNITDLHQDQDRLRAEIQSRFPDYAALINPKPPTIAQVQAALHPGEAFVSTYSLDDRTLIWAIPKTGTPVFVSSSVKSADLATAAATLRDALDPQASTLADIPPFDVAAAHKLYAGLLEPAAAGWKDAKSLVIASDWLGRVPAGLLVTQSVAQPEDKQGEELFAGYRSVPFLIRQVSVAQVPSAATLVSLRALPQGAASRQAFVGFGDPVFTAQQAAQEKADLANAATAAPQQTAMTETRSVKLRAAPKVDKLAHADLSMVPRLPDTAQELREVAATLKANPSTDLFLGPAANEHQVETMKLDDRRVLMFATHGLVPGDLDGLTQPALALSAPALSGTDGSGLLTMEKIMGLKLDADWVVLSACNTGAGEERGAEAVSGLGRAFFYAGARAVLVTNWPVETESARFLTTAAFRHQSQEPGINRAEALRQSELDLIGSEYRGNDGKPIFSYAHPLFWAPFTLVGDEG